MAGIRGNLCWTTCIGETIQRTECEMQKRANELYNKTRIEKEKEIWLTAYSLLKSVMNIVSMLRKMCAQVVGDDVHYLGCMFGG